MKHRITPRFIITLEPNEVFVFGSNLAGIHGAGAAKYALRFGAKLGSPTGLQGNSYAIPTKDIKIEHTLSFNVIGAFIEEFIKRSVKPTHRFLAWVGCKRPAPLNRCTKLINISYTKLHLFYK